MSQPATSAANIHPASDAEEETVIAIRIVIAISIFEVANNFFITIII